MMASSDTLTFRRMRTDDLPVILRMEREIYPQPWSERIFRDELARDDRVYIIAEVDGTIVGFGGLMLVAEDAHITTLAVRPNNRQVGLGTMLMLQLVEAALNRGSLNLTLEVRSANVSAQRLYEKFEMAAVGVRKHYYRDDDAVIMWVTDIDRPEYAARLREIEASMLEAS